MEKKFTTKTMVLSALMAALTCIATMIIHIPTPTMGYIHPGDCFVILCGIFLGPAYGFLSAGIGSMLADILTGYMIYAIPTLVIKGLSALIAALVFRNMKQIMQKTYPALLIGSFLCELNVVFGYFVNKIVKVMFLAKEFSQVTFAEGLTSAISGILPNTVQGIVGIILACCLFPLLSKIPDIKTAAQNYNKTQL